MKFAQAHEVDWLRDVRAQIEKDVAGRTVSRKFWARPKSGAGPRD